jgi:Uma2 family endonuclease
MSAAPKQYVTPEQYLAMERQAEYKSEYYDGEVFAMAGGSEAHSLIAVNLTRELSGQLLERPCRVYNSDMKVHTNMPHYSYPDVTIVCGEPQFVDEHRDTLLNPTVVIEVLSPTTEAWDRGGKFQQYRQRESLQEYVLIAQDQPHIERFVRQADGQWLMSEVSGLEAVLPMPSIGCELALALVYLKVEFPEAGTRPY